MVTAVAKGAQHVILFNAPIILNYANCMDFTHIIILKNDRNTSTFRILAFLSGCTLALLKAECSPLKKILAVNIKNNWLWE